MRTLGQKPALSEVLEYYDRPDVREYVHSAGLVRKVSLFWRSEPRWHSGLRGSFLFLRRPEDLLGAVVAPFGDLLGVLEDHPDGATLNQIVESPGPRGVGSARRRLEKLRNMGAVRVERVGRRNRYTLRKDAPVSFYPSLHWAVDVLDECKDFVLEADCRGWRRSFDDVYGSLEILDRFEVPYRIKFSGRRSLHLMIPWEAFPERVGCVSVRRQWTRVHSRIKEYFIAYGGLRVAHKAFGLLRLPYSVNENTGLVSLPIPREQLEEFRPWEASIHQVEMANRPWFGDLPMDAQSKTARFLEEVFSCQPPKGRPKHHRGMRIRPKVTGIRGDRPGDTEVEVLVQRLQSPRAAERTEAAWNLMVGGLPVPIGALEEGLGDEEATVRWFLAETLPRLGEGIPGVMLGAKLLKDRDPYVRASAADYLIHAYGTNPSLPRAPLFSSGGNRYHIAYITRKVCDQNPQAWEGMIQGLIDHSEAVGDARVLETVFSYLSSLAPMDSRRKMLTFLLQIMANSKASSESVRALENIWPNNALTRTLSFRIAESLGVPEPIRQPRVLGEDAEKITALMDGVLKRLTPAGRMNMAAAMLVHGRNPTRIASATVLTGMGSRAVPSLISAVKTTGLMAKWPHNSLRLSAGTVARVLKQIDPDPVGSLLEPLGSSDHQTRMGTLLLIRALGMRQGVQHVVKMLDDPSVTVRRFAVRALGGIPGEPAINGLVEALRDPNRLVRAEALRQLLQHTDHSKAKHAVKKCQHDRSKLVRVIAREATTPQTD